LLFLTSFIQHSSFDPKSVVKKIFHSFTRRERIAFGGALCVALLSALFLVLSYVRNSTVLVPADGGTFTEGIVGQPTFINPVLTGDDVNEGIVHLVFSPLKDMAEKIEADPARPARAWNVRLKDGLFWQDGEKITSDDIVFTIKKIQDPESESPLRGVWQGVAINRLSEREVQFIVPAPYAPFTAILENMYVIPKHAFADVPPSNWRFSKYNLEPVGNGPYQIISVEKRADGFISSVTFSPSKNYFGVAPHLQTVLLRFFSTTDELVKAFNAGKIDGWFNFEPDTLGGIKRPYSEVAFRTAASYSVFFNPGKNQVLKDNGVRHALVDAIDKSALVKNMFPYPTLTMEGPLVPETETPNTSQASSSAIQAGTDLENAGWHLGSDGVRRKQTSNTASSSLEFTLSVPQVPFLIKTAQMLADQWRAAGVLVHVQLEPDPDMLGTRIKNRDYEMLLYGTMTDETNDLYAFWHSSQRFAPGLNFALYSNKNVDSLLESIRQSTAITTSSSQTDRLQNLITGDAPALFLYAPTYEYILGNSMEGVDGGFDPSTGLGADQLTTSYITRPASRFDNVSSWYLETKRVFKK
jgi:peptide/nickel transport system substrate-binding protein